MDHIADRLEIRDLAARYADYVDTFQTLKIMTGWSADAISAESHFGTGWHNSAADIGAFFEGLAKSITRQARITSNHLIDEIDDSKVKAIVSSNVEAVTITCDVRAVVYCADDYVKQSGRWVFGSRVSHSLMPIDTAAFGQVNAN